MPPPVRNEWPSAAHWRAGRRAYLTRQLGLHPFQQSDDGIVYTIFESNLEFQKGSKRKKISKGWNVFGVPPDSDDGDDDEPFMID